MTNRRRDDENDSGVALRNGRPTILGTALKYGLSTFLVLYLLGVFSYVGLKPPYFDCKMAIDAHEQKMDERDQRTLDTLRGICQNKFCNR